jgi:hypothetical protein
MRKFLQAIVGGIFVVSPLVHAEPTRAMQMPMQQEPRSMTLREAVRDQHLPDAGTSMLPRQLSAEEHMVLRQQLRQQQKSQAGSLSR